MRARAPTETILRPNVSVIVEEYKCQDHTTLNKIGAQAKQRNWQLRAVGEGANSFGSTDSDRVSEPVTINAIIDHGVAGVKGTLLGTQVGLSMDKKQVFPEKGSKAKLYDDFAYEWKFHATLDGLGLVAPGELWIPGTLPTDVPCEPGISQSIQGAVLGQSELRSIHEVQLGEQRCAAVLTRQWPDGCFEVSAFRPNENGILQEVHLPSVNPSVIFVRATGHPIRVPECAVAFQVHKAKPEETHLNVDGVSFKQFLGRVSPNLADGTPQRLVMDVPKRPAITESIGSVLVGEHLLEEQPITMNVGASVLRDYVSGKVYRGESGSSRFQKWWELQLGPFAKHKIRLVKASAMNSHMTLYVDDKVLVDCSSQDISSTSDAWQCKFSFVGERSIDFHVFEETADGVQLDTKDVVAVPHSYKHVIEVAYHHKMLDHLADAALSIDGIPFGSFPLKVELHDEPNLSVTRDVLGSQYGLEVPKKVLPQDTRGTARKIAGHVAGNVWREIEGQKDPLNEVAARKAGELGLMISKMGTDAYEFCTSFSLQRAAWSCAPPETSEISI